MADKKVKHDCYKQEYLFILGWQECHIQRTLITTWLNREGTPPGAEKECDWLARSP